MFDAIKARREHDEERVQLFLWGVRKISFFAGAGNFKNLKEKSIYELEIDAQVRKRRFKGTKPMKVTIDGKEQ